MVFFFQAEDGIRDYKVTGVQTCALPISDHDDAVHAMLAEPPEGAVSALRRLELGGTCAPEHGAAELQDARDVARAERLELAVDQARVPLPHAHDLEPAAHPGPHHGPERRVQPGRVAAARQHRHPLERHPLVLPAMMPSM